MQLIYWFCAFQQWLEQCTNARAWWGCRHFGQVFVDINILRQSKSLTGSANRLRYLARTTSKTRLRLLYCRLCPPPKILQSAFPKKSCLFKELPLNRSGPFCYFPKILSFFTNPFLLLYNLRQVVIRNADSGKVVWKNVLCNCISAPYNNATFHYYRAARFFQLNIYFHIIWDNNAYDGQVMGLKGRRVHMIEELTETIISFQRWAFVIIVMIQECIVNPKLFTRLIAYVELQDQ